MRVLYISGPMAGYPEMNYPRFDRAAEAFRKSGEWDKVISPAEVGRKCDETFVNPCPQDYMVDNITALVHASAIALLPGWTNSTGAVCEAAIAKTFNLDFYDIDGDELIKIDTPLYITVTKSYPKRG